MWKLLFKKVSSGLQDLVEHKFVSSSDMIVNQLEVRKKDLSEAEKGCLSEKQVRMPRAEQRRPQR